MLVIIRRLCPTELHAGTAAAEGRSESYQHLAVHQNIVCCT
jgi:hypothetical protein